MAATPLGFILIKSQLPIQCPNQILEINHEQHSIGDLYMAI